MKKSVFFVFLLLTFVISCNKKPTTPQAPPATDNTPELGLKRANELLGMKRCREALPFYQQFLSKYPKDAGAWNMFGLAYVCDTQFDAGIQAFQQALAIQPTYTDVHNNLGVTYTEKKNYAEARKEFIEALEDSAYPKAGPYFNLGKLAFVQGSYEESRALAKKALDFLPKQENSKQHVAPLLLYAISLERLNRLSEARSSFEDLLNVDPNNLEGNYFMANILMQQNEACLARQHYLKVVDADPLGDLGQKAIGAMKNIHCSE